ncbi:hypothetical protein ACF073_15540 [Streptomyces sp. NPDC015171]|uniref:hypothetical protein n=1 Tax=Streptomyces sp. NPDC015171 TaxID=3364945 RepID=UPI0036FF6029
MRKIITTATLALAALALAAPAHADDDRNFSSGVNAANNWNFTAADVCFQEMAVVPAVADYLSDYNTCSNGNTTDPSGS